MFNNYQLLQSDVNSTIKMVKDFVSIDSYIKIYLY